jgi:hypothetical protein
MRIQARDSEMLFALYSYDGVLARRHLKGLFWPTATWRAMEMRLALLYRHQYLDWPSREHWRTRPVPEPICWLGWQGALHVASELGITVEYPKSTRETQIRRLATALREHGFHWLREPRWSQLAHDVAATDVRLTIERAVSETPGLRLETWIPESGFRFDTDVVDVTVPSHNGSSRKKKRGVRPDGYFVLVDEYRQHSGLPPRARFLVEVDMGTHDTGSFFAEKVLAGRAYVQSPAYRKRFGGNTGRWLVVTKGETRLRHLKGMAQGIGADMFWFTTLAEISAQNPLTGPIWRQAGEDAPKEIVER